MLISPYTHTQTDKNIFPSIIVENDKKAKKENAALELLKKFCLRIFVVYILTCDVENVF